MELKSFRELLLKKAADNPTLQTIIHVMKDELIADRVIEALEKMARPHARMGSKANAGVTAFASSLTNKDVNMIRDALAHHVSHYKAALKNNNREVADAHLEKIIPLIHLVAQSSTHSNGRLSADYINPQAWEANITTEERNPATGRRIEETEGWGRRPKPNSKRIYTPKDYRYFEMSPHPEHEHIKTNSHSHRGGYPFEELQVGNPAKIDAKEAYLDISDPGAQDSFVPHPFDYHPVHKIQDLTQAQFNSVADQYLKDLGQWSNSEHHNNWMQSLKDKAIKDPESIKNSGKKKPDHHFKDIALLEQPESVTGKVTSETVSNLPPELQTMAAKQSRQPSLQSVPPVKPAASQISEQDISNLPPALRSKFGQQQSSASEVKPVESQMSEQDVSNLPPALRAKFGGK